MLFKAQRRFLFSSCGFGIVLAASLLCATTLGAQTSGPDSSSSQSPQQDKAAGQQAPQDKPAQDKKASKSSDPATTKLRIHVTANDKPVGNASVYVRFPVTGGLFHKEKLAELNLKTNEDGSAKVPDIPRGQVLIQVVAKGWKTFGKWFEISSDEQTVEIKLEPPPHWY